MNYIGSKHSLIGEIETILKENGVAAEGVALDLFSGTGAVAKAFKKMGFVTYANDWQFYSFVTTHSFIGLNAVPDNGMEALRLLDRLPGKEGEFFHEFCEGGQAGRQYFSKENGLRIQSIRDQIDAWVIAESDKHWLVACLIESADRVANTASVYGAYLKHIKKSAQKPMRLVPIEPIPSKHQHRAFCLDAKQMLQQFNQTKIKLTYIDPPYNHRQYSGNYHILETIARWDLDRFKPRGVTGLRHSKELQSPYCRRSKAFGAFQELLARVNSEYVLFSYNNEGLLSEQELVSLLPGASFKKIPYQRFRADNDGENRNYKKNSTEEFLILVRQTVSK